MKTYFIQMHNEVKRFLSDALAGRIKVDIS